MKIRPMIFIAIILLNSLMFRIFIMYSLPINKIASEPLLFFELINRQAIIPPWLIIGLGLINLLLIFIINRRIISYQVGIISAFLYGISPWIAYLEVAGSLYIFLISCLLIFFIALQMSNSRNNLSLVMLVISSALMLYSSLLMWIVLPLLIITFLKVRLVNNKNLKIYLLALLLMSLPIMFAMLKNVEGVRNILSLQITLFSNVGLINSVNVFRGEVNQTKFAIIAQLIENRYSYLSEHFLFNLLKHISPVTYFTSEFKMLNFSFSPPILLGFLLPFLLGLKYLFQSWGKYKWAFIAVIALILPSVLSKNSPDINRLSLVAPVLFLFIGLGFTELINRKELIYKFLLFSVLILVLIQGLTTISDISLRESVRLQQHKT